MNELLVAFDEIFKGVKASTDLIATCETAYDALMDVVDQYADTDAGDADATAEMLVATIGAVAVALRAMVVHMQTAAAGPEASNP